MFQIKTNHTISTAHPPSSSPWGIHRGCGAANVQLPHTEPVNNNINSVWGSSHLTLVIRESWVSSLPFYGSPPALLTQTMPGSWTSLGPRWLTAALIQRSRRGFLESGELLLWGKLRLAGVHGFQRTTWEGIISPFTAIKLTAIVFCDLTPSQTNPRIKGDTLHFSFRGLCFLDLCNAKHTQIHLQSSLL